MMIIMCFFPEKENILVCQQYWVKTLNTYVSVYLWQLMAEQPNKKTTKIAFC